MLNLASKISLFNEILKVLIFLACSGDGATIEAKANSFFFWTLVISYSCPLLNDESLYDRFFKDFEPLFFFEFLTHYVD